MGWKNIPTRLTKSASFDMINDSVIKNNNQTWSNLKLNTHSPVGSRICCLFDELKTFGWICE